MATQPDRGRWTYDEFARLPDDGNRYEVIAGELYVTPAPRSTHQIVLGDLMVRLSAFVSQHALGWVLPGPIDVLFAEGDYLEPDLVFVRRERRGIISERGIEAAPDLVVEILSASTAARDRGIKRERYAWFGVPEYWIVDIEARLIERFRLADDAVLPSVETEVLHWQPIADGPTLAVSVPDVVRGFA